MADGGGFQDDEWWSQPELPTRSFTPPPARTASSQPRCETPTVLPNFRTIKTSYVDNENVVYIHDGFGYRKDKMYKGKIYLKCHFNRKCGGRAVIADGQLVVNERTSHTCSVDQTTWDLHEAKIKIREAVKSSAEAPRTIYSKVMEHQSPRVLSQLNFNSVKQAIHREQVKSLPKDESVKIMMGRFENNEYSGQHQMYQDLYQGSVIITHEGQRYPALIFGDPEILEKVTPTVEYAFIDATFKVAPFPFTQVLNVMGEFNGAVVPIFHVLMTGKFKSLYASILEKIFMTTRFRPKTFMMDFELGLRCAVKEVYHEAEVIGCRFHFSQAIERYAKSDCCLGAIMYKPQNIDLLDRIHQYEMLPLLKPEHFKSQLERIKEEILDLALPKGVVAKVRQLHNYILDFWCGVVTPEEISVAGKEFKTNNHIESLHAKMNRHLAPNTTLFTFLRSLNEHIIRDARILVRQKVEDPNWEGPSQNLTHRRKLQLR